MSRSQLYAELKYFQTKTDALYKNSPCTLLEKNLPWNQITGFNKCDLEQDPEQTHLFRNGLCNSNSSLTKLSISEEK